MTGTMNAAIDSRRRSTRLSSDSKITCAVSGCNSNGGTKNGRSVMFFDVPPKSNNDRLAWFKAVPALALQPTSGSVQNKVCEEHFVDGRPTPENPAPTLLLDSRKRSAVDSIGELALFDNNKVVKEEESDSPTPTKVPTKTIRLAPTPGIKWRTSTGTPKQLAFKQTPLVRADSNGHLKKPSNGINTNGSGGPNLATMLAGIVNDPPSCSSSPSTYRPTTFRPVSKLTIPSHGPSSSSSCKSVDCTVASDETCPRCMNALPLIRRSMGRMESRMDAAISMLKQCIQKHPTTISNTITMPINRNTPMSRVVSLMSPSSSTSLLNRSDNGPKVLIAKPSSNISRSSVCSALPRLFADKSTPLAPFSFMHKMITKGILLHRASEFTVDEYMKTAPKAVRAYSETQVMHIIGQLLKDGLLKKVDESVDGMDPECIFEKEQDQSKLYNLKKYDVSERDYLAGCFDD